MASGIVEEIVHREIAERVRQQVGIKFVVICYTDIY